MSRPRFSGAILALPAAFALLGASAAAQLQWVQRTTGDPLPRYRHALAYDSARAECVLFSGAPSPTQDTWVWDGVHWEQRFPALSPSPQTGYALAYDSARQVVVLYGQASETFEWNGTSWSDRTPALGPSTRDRSALAYDEGRGVSVLFGGHLVFTNKSDTWEWNGSTWTQRSPATVPEARAYHGMAYDAARARIVMFGGFGTAAPLADTWEWDGTDWARKTPATSPSPRQLASLAYDEGRQRVVLYGGTVPGFGALEDTWEWDGTNWIERFPAHHPPTLYEYGLAFDSARGVTVLVGGVTDRSVLTSTWEWNGNDWTERRTGPPARQRHALAFDPGRGRTVLFGGFQDPLFLDDTWEWDGTEWIEAEPLVPQPPLGSKVALFAGRPEGRIETALAYDARRRRIVMFGGQGRSGRPLDDTWEWNGTSWSERLSLVHPAPRHGHAMAYDETRGRLVLFGGSAGDFSFSSSFSDTWEWDGVRWIERFPSTVPPGREDFAMAYDPARGRVLLFAGESCPPFDSCTPLDDAWEWDGDDWTPRGTGPAARGYHALAHDRNRARTVLFGGIGYAGSLEDEWEWDGSSWTPRPLPGPSARHGHALAFDSVRGRTVLFGGADNGGDVSSATWELYAACDVIGPGHAGGGLAIACSHEPRIGASACVTFSTSSGAPHLLMIARGPCRIPPVPVDGPALCAPGLLYPGPGVVASGSGAPALYCSNVPADPTLIGATFCLQGAARDPGGCWRLTDGLSLTLQP